MWIFFFLLLKSKLDGNVCIRRENFIATSEFTAFVFNWDNEDNYLLLTLLIRY